jgi:hypothetical protein
MVAAGVCAGPLQAAKSKTVSQQRLALLMPRSSAAAAARPRAEIVIQVKASNGYKQVRVCRGTRAAVRTQAAPAVHARQAADHVGRVA